MPIQTQGPRPKDIYFDLVRRFPLRPIRSDKELDQAIAVVDSLIDRFDQLSIDESDYLDILTAIIERYEAEAVPIQPVSDGELLRHLIESKGITQADAARGTGISESTISDVLAGRRHLNRTHIGRLARYFNIEPGAFTFGL